MSPRCLLPLLLAALAGPALAFDVERVSVDGDSGQIPAASSEAALSHDGRFVAFVTRAGLVAEDTNDLDDVYLKDRQTGELRLISRSITPLPADRPSRQPDVGVDGDVVFISAATNLVRNDQAGQVDVFLYDWDQDTVIRITRGADGMEANGGSDSPRISLDGKVVAFGSSASNLVADDTNGVADIFIYSLLLGDFRRVSVSSSGGEANGPSSFPTLSEDGLTVAFSSFADNLNPVGGNQLRQIYVHDVLLGKTTRVELPADTIERSDVFSDPHVSGDGEWIAFVRTRDGGAGRADLFLQEFATGESIRVTDPAGLSLSESPNIGAISYGGHRVLFDTIADTVVPGDSNNQKDVFVYDRLLDESIRASGPGANAGGNGESTALDMTSGGEVVLFVSRASNLVPGDTNGAQDIFLNDLAEFRIDVDITGSWYDVSQDGHGFILEYLDGNRLLFYWFTFTPGGDREWIFGVLEVGPDGRVAEGQAFRQLGDGARFPPAIDPAGISTEPWGTIRFEFTGCSTGNVSWDASPPYQDGSMNLTRLTSLAGRSCD